MGKLLFMVEVFVAVANERDSVIPKLFNIFLLFFFKTGKLENGRMRLESNVHFLICAGSHGNLGTRGTRGYHTAGAAGPAVPKLPKLWGV